jgi:hypothetical protein
LRVRDKHSKEENQLTQDRSTMAARGPAERPEKILVAMSRLANGTSTPLKYEDIVVAAFEMFPEDFALRGYPQYPDSSDLHKPLYGPLKRSGLVLAANKTFQLTPLGIAEASRLAAPTRSTIGAPKNSERMPRDLQVEADRMLQSEAFRLVREGRESRVLDTDLYAFLSCTVRTSPNDFTGRIRLTEQTIAAAIKSKYPTREAADQLQNAWASIREKHAQLIALRVETKKRERR